VHTSTQGDVKNEALRLEELVNITAGGWPIGDWGAERGRVDSAGIRHKNGGDGGTWEKPYSSGVTITIIS
jgi:hypothetical protein